MISAVARRHVGRRFRPSPSPAQSHLRVPPSRVRAAGDGPTPTATSLVAKDVPFQDHQNALNGTSTSPCCSSGAFSAPGHCMTACGARASRVSHA
eukprot:4839547-Prymnesium_polylepis.1